MNPQTITEAVFNCNSDRIPAGLTQHKFLAGKNSMPALAMWISIYDYLPEQKRDAFIQDLCKKGLDLNAQYTIDCPADTCSYTVLNALSQAILPDACDPALCPRFNPDCIRALLAAGAEPNSPYGFIASDSAEPLEGSVLMMALRKGYLSAARLLLEHGARFNQETDKAPLANACACTHDIRGVLELFLAYFNKGQITLRDVRAADGETALQMYARRYQRFEGDLDILVNHFGLKPSDGSAICIAREMEQASMRMQLYDRVLVHRQMAAEMEAMQ